jgi:hypothetical protein
MDMLKLLINMRSPFPQFFVQMSPFQEKLPIRFVNLAHASRFQDLYRIEVITSPFGFRSEASQKNAYCRKRPGVLPKPDELGMMRISGSQSRQYFLRQQRFSPCSRQTFGIKIAGVKCPQSHSEQYFSAILV